MVKNRIWFIDYAKIIGLWMVIFAHLYSSEGIGEINIIRTYIYGFHMPFFFAVSGMLYKQRKEGLKYALLKNVKSLFIPWLVFNLLFLIIEVINTGNIFIDVFNIFCLNVYKGKDTFCGASWFIICLFFIKCIFDILKYSNKTYLAYIIILLTFLPKIRNFYLAQTTIGFTFYYLGSVSIKYLTKIDLKKWQVSIVALTCFIVSYFLTKVNGKVSILAAHLKNPFLFYINSIIGSLGIIFFASLFKTYKINFIAKLSTSSIAVVLIHMAIVKQVRVFRSHFQLNDIELFFWYSIVAACIYIICYYLYVVIKKITPWAIGGR